MSDQPLKFTPDAVGRIDSKNRIFGENLPDLSKESLKVLRASKATAHKLQGMIVCAAPMMGNSILLHCYHRLPKGARLNDAVTFAKEEADKFEMARPASIAAQTRATFDDGVSRAFQSVVGLKPKHQAKQFLHALQDGNVKSAFALAPITNGKLGKIVFHKSEHAHVVDALRHAMSQSLKDEETQLDLTVLAKQLHAKNLEFLKPSKTDRAVVIALLDATQDDRNKLIASMGFLGALNPNRPSLAAKKSLISRFALVSVLTAGLLYLFMPAPIYVSNFAVTRPSEAQVIALPFGAFLEQVNIRAGQIAKNGQTIVTLRAPQIEDALAEQVIQTQLEEITAQEALDIGNIAEFQLAEKRKEIAIIRTEQLNERAAILNVKTKGDAKVVSIQSQSDKGMFLGEGSPIVTLQNNGKHDIIIEVKHADAARLKAGQKGRVTFRGLSVRNYDFTVLSAPVLSPNPNGPTPVLQIVARLNSPDQSDLINGLNGFAKIDTGEAPRIVGLTRSLREYIRVNLWTYLGITF